MSSFRPLRMAVGSLPRTLDPPNATSGASHQVIGHVCETLVTRDSAGQIIPWLAESWEVSPDGREYLFHIRPGVNFYAGDPLNGAAVAANLKRLSTEPTRRWHLLAPIVEQVEAVDLTGVRVRLKTPFAPFLAILTDTALAMVSPQMLAERQVQAALKSEEKFDDTKQHQQDIAGWGRKLTGTGPFVLMDWDGSDTLVLRRNENYWGTKPGVEQVLLQGIPQGQDRLTALLDKRVDAALLLPLGAVERLRNQPGIRVLEVPSDSWFFVGMNNLKSPFDDIRVRRALNFAVDKEAIVRDVFKGAGRPVDSCIARGSFGYASIYTYPYDPDRARQLLAEAGLGDGFVTELASPRGRYPMDFETSLAVAEHLAEVGVSVKVVPYDDWGEYLTYVRQPPERATHQMFLLMRGEGSMRDAHYTLFTKFHSQGWYHSNNQYYRNPEVDRLTESGSFSLDPEQRQQAYAKAQQLIIDDAAMIFLNEVTYTLAYQTYIEGIGLSSTEMYDLRGAKFNSQ